MLVGEGWFLCALQRSGDPQLICHILHLLDLQQQPAALRHSPLLSRCRVQAQEQKAARQAADAGAKPGASGAARSLPSPGRWRGRTPCGAGIAACGSAAAPAAASRAVPRPWRPCRTAAAARQRRAGRPLSSACCHSSCELPCLVHGVVLGAAARQCRTGRPLCLSKACEAGPSVAAVPAATAAVSCPASCMVWSW